MVRLRPQRSDRTGSSALNSFLISESGGEIGSVRIRAATDLSTLGSRRREAGLEFGLLRASFVGLIDNYQPGIGSWPLVQVPEN